MKKFDYLSDYKKFKPKDKVKITFIEGKKEITKKGRIISIDAKGISFENKGYIYGYSPAEIKNIRKRNKKLLVIFFVFLIGAVINFIYSSYRSLYDWSRDDRSRYEDFTEKYGLIFDDNIDDNWDY